MIGDSGGLVHVVGDDDDGDLFAQVSISCSILLVAMGSRGGTRVRP